MAHRPRGDTRMLQPYRILLLGERTADWHLTLVNQTMWVNPQEKAAETTAVTAKAV